MKKGSNYLFGASYPIPVFPSLWPSEVKLRVVSFQKQPTFNFHRTKVILIPRKCEKAFTSANDTKLDLT